MSAPGRVRLRDLGVSIGRFAPGPYNAITDVPGVRVGHATLDQDAADDRTVQRTGVTAILPVDGDIFDGPIVGGHFVLNGAGEVSGLIQVAEWGLIETPILLTNTLSVGAVSHGVVQYLVERFPEIGREHDVIIPLVGECDDSFLNDIRADHVTPEHVFEALDAAATGPVAEGSVGAGTGMVTCDLKAGIGTASRRVPIANDSTYTLGVLVMSNFGRLEDLRLDGMPLGAMVAPRYAELERRRSLYGSIIVVLGTDAPLQSRQLDRLCKRAALGVGRVGSYAAHGSGEICVGFSTANIVPRGSGAATRTLTLLRDTALDPLYQAAVECTEEAILNALCGADTMVGVDGHVAPGLPLELVAEAWAARREFLRRYGVG
ncbi:MAG: P1 family peptidase [Myxococcales bacterium]|nr:P1 family peptidase [Myxococcales bacterium]MCB9531318.1 P1 family peptidase [Myxococcales bacterium]